MEVTKKMLLTQPDGKVQTRFNSSESQYVSTFNSKNVQETELSNFYQYGCCEFIRSTRLSSGNGTSTTDNKDRQADMAMSRLNLGSIAPAFRDADFIYNFLHFCNNIIPEADLGLKLISYDGSKIDGRRLPKKLQKTVFQQVFKPEKGYAYIAYNVRNNNKGGLNLAALSYARMLTYSAYYAYAYTMMELRKKEELSHLNNYEISQLAAYTNNHVGNGGMFYVLYAYKSPVNGENVARFIQRSTEAVYKKVNGNNLNSSYSGKHHVYSLAHIKQLFKAGKYVEIYNKLTTPVTKHVMNHRLNGKTAVMNGKKYLIPVFDNNASMYKEKSGWEDGLKEVK